ncbi:MAG: hypothetical protein LBD28_00015 [Tannerellaceae bacterium]|jgi:DNA-binding SARP family transcriptional activator|nr:hypothetical protein [Tannerellaceae bacterium]
MNKAYKAVLMLAALLVALALHAGAEETARGLYFHSLEVNKDSRTRLNLTPDGPLRFSGGFTLSFDFKLRQEEHEVFGYVLRIIGNERTNIDLISNASQFHNMVLVVDNRTFIEFNLNDLAVPPSEWTHATLKVDARRERLDFTLGDIHKSSTCDNIRGLNKFAVYFGGNDHPRFGTSDVAPIMLRDVKILDARDRLERYWRLSKHHNDAVYDECKNARASVTNALWEINQHSHWEKIRSIEIDGKYPKIAFDRRRKQAFVVSNKFVYIYNIAANSVDTLEVKHGAPFNVELNQLFYDAAQNSLVMYEFETQTLARFDFATQSWSNRDASVRPPPLYRHHNKWYDEGRRRGYILGGYGFHLYSALLQSFSDSLGRWETVDLAAAYPPRYLAGMGEYNDSLLLCFGGYGSVSGRQHEAPHNYYDLYALNPTTRSVRKLWELLEVDEPFANAASLIVNRGAETFYTLSYPNNIYETRATLHEYNIKHPGYRKLADAIPFLFNDEESYCDLFMPSDSSVILAALSNAMGSGSVVNLYSIAYPPMSVADTLQVAPSESSPYAVALYMGLIFSGILIVAAVLVLFRKWRRRSSGEASGVASGVSQGDSGGEESHLTTVEVPAYPAINVLNNFRVLDSKGGDLTHLFSPTGAQIFLLIYFKTVSDQTGITSNELQQAFWPDKDYESAQNNRNVYFTKLRSILNDMGNVRIDRLNNFWALAYDAKKIHSDYAQALSNIRQMLADPETDKALLRETLQIIMKGTLLPFLKADWLDHYKTNYSNTVIEFLGKIAERPDIRGDYQILLHIADAILMQDEIEESGIRLKCSVLYKQGKKQQAMLAYDKYAEAYHSLLDILPSFTFKDIIRLSSVL